MSGKQDNIVIPTQDHQVKAFEQAETKDKKQGGSSAGSSAGNIVHPTQQHQVEALEQHQPPSSAWQTDNIVIPNQEQLKAFEQPAGGNAAGGEFHDNQFHTTVANVLTNANNSIFSSYTRRFKEFEKRLDNSSSQFLVFAPTDAAVEELSFKPWEFPRDVTSSNDAADQVSDANIKDFINSHIVESKSNFDKFTNGLELITLNGNRLTLKNGPESLKVRIDGEDAANVIETKIVENGAIMTIDHPLSKP